MTHKTVSSRSRSLDFNQKRPRPLSPTSNRKEEPLVQPVPPLRVEPVEEARVPSSTPIEEIETPVKGEIPTAEPPAPSESEEPKTIIEETEIVAVEAPPALETVQEVEIEPVEIPAEVAAPEETSASVEAEPA